MRRHSRTLCYDFPAICGGIRRIPMDNHQPWHFRRFIRVPRCDLWLWFLKCPIDVLRLSTGVESYVGTIWYNDIQCTHKTGYSWLFYVILRIGNHLGVDHFDPNRFLPPDLPEGSMRTKKAIWPQPRYPVHDIRSSSILRFKQSTCSSKMLEHLRTCQHDQPATKTCDANSIKLPRFCHDFGGSRMLHPSTPISAQSQTRISNLASWKLAVASCRRQFSTAVTWQKCGWNLDKGGLL